ncbi:MAG: tRNA pseudouridine(38-40) synthase TruA [Sulfurovum sp.]|nr:tRNA pseudouridine(38-40) synthase TruA [Sulfurovum sp.]
MEIYMYHHRLVISYKGSNYFGWQDLGEKDEKATVQATINEVLKQICKQQKCNISTASRTDAGVHAQGQVVKITIPLVIASEKLLLGMNSLLPEDIRILKCESCPATFNPNRDSKSKEYHYYFCTDPISNPVYHDIVAHITSRRGTLDIEGMQEACKCFIGEHDFYSFAKRDATMHMTLRTIISCEILEAKSSIFGSKIYYLKIVGTGFLRHMVRYIAGALFEIGKKQLSVNDVTEALVMHKEKKVSAKAKAKGLHLIEVFY